jgi:predicted DNA-binding transcriptional regulator YafY
MEIQFEYTNYKGEASTRTIVPLGIRFGYTEWHPQEQYLLNAYDCNKREGREFAMKDIKNWRSKLTTKGN